MTRRDLEIVDNDAIRIGDLYSQARDSFVGSVQYLIECGQALISKRETLEHGQWLPWLRSNEVVLGFKQRTAYALIKAANLQLTANLTEREALRISRQIWGNEAIKGTTGTGENEWYTPEKYVEAARVLFDGEIDLDPASSEIAQQVIQAREWFSKEQNGLEREWYGKIWLNPPYAQPLIYQFIDKLATEFGAGRTLEAVVLTHNYSDTSWFHALEPMAPKICWTRGRIGFLSIDGSVAAPTQGQVFFYCGDRADRFEEIFSQFGFVR